MSDEANLPWFKFYPQEFMGDENVQLMGPAELGIYIAMLCHQWKAGAVPDDPKMVARICRGTPDQVEEAWTLIRPCFEPDGERDGYIVQPRLEKERAAAIRRRESARNAAQAKADGNAERDADRSADGNADRTPERGAMRASNASDGQKNRDTEVTELQEVQTADSDESALRALADLGSNPPEDEEVRKRVTDALVKAWLSLQPVRPPRKANREAGGCGQATGEGHRTTEARYRPLRPGAPVGARREGEPVGPVHAGEETGEGTQEGRGGHAKRGRE